MDGHGNNLVMPGPRADHFAHARPDPLMQPTGREHMRLPIFQVAFNT